ncbi:hypothetical protein [Patiriisocius sp. Uisw_017]|jgi:hypothetical protein|uniref:hypothetical protein n=1 Tax=Patiriisocius sp. Uisw_017 TaxID=3230968 RepID=UPI0039E913CE
MNPSAYEHCWIGEERFDYPSAYEELIVRLQEHFPHEKKGIRRYGETFPGILISLTRLKNLPSFDGRYHTLEAITFINYESFK